MKNQNLKSFISFFYYLSLHVLIFSQQQLFYTIINRQLMIQYNLRSASIGWDSFFLFWAVSVLSCSSNVFFCGAPANDADKRQIQASNQECQFQSIAAVLPINSHDVNHGNRSLTKMKVCDSTQLYFPCRIVFVHACALHRKKIIYIIRDTIRTASIYGVGDSVKI